MDRYQHDARDPLVTLGMAQLDRFRGIRDADVGKRQDTLSQVAFQEGAAGQDEAEADRHLPEDAAEVAYAEVREQFGLSGARTDQVGPQPGQQALEEVCPMGDQPCM